MTDTQRCRFGDMEKAGIEAHQFGIVMEGEGRDEQVEGAWSVAFLPAAEAKVGGIAPEGCGRWEKGKCGEPGFELCAFG